MTTQRTVVVGIDGSPGSRTALRWALAEAQLWSTPLEVLHARSESLAVLPADRDPERVDAGSSDAAAVQLIDRELDAVGADLATVEIKQTPAHGSVARALVEASRHAALVVVGRRGIGGFPRELIGPKAVQLAHHGTSPVAVVPDGWTGDGRGIVVGVDGSAHAAHALTWAYEEAQRRSARLTALLAWGLLDQYHLEDDARFDPTYSAQDAREFVEHAVRSALDGRAADVTPAVVNDLPARALVDAAAGAELLVVGARGLGGFSGLLLGSVSQRCLAHSVCPTVLVR